MAASPTEAPLTLRAAEPLVLPGASDAPEAQASSDAPADKAVIAVGAFKARDAEASRRAHEASSAPGKAKENHGGMGSDFVKSLVFGGLDGVITTFSIVAASAGADLTVQTALLLGLSNLIADGISMGVGDFLSSHAELKHIQAEHEREKWEFENYAEGEIAEMVELYEKKGVASEDAALILRTMAKYPQVFLPHMVQEELGLPPYDPDENPAKEGLVTFLSFLVFGSVPVITYAIILATPYRDTQGIFGIACATTVCTMFALGATQAVVTRQPVLKSAVLMTVNGSLAAASAYLVGWGLDQAFGSNVGRN